MRRPDGVALLVAGHEASGASALDASMVHTLGQIGEALLATGAAWQIRRLSSGAGERFAADRATLKRQIDELASQPVRVAVLVVLGKIAALPGGPALITGEGALAYPEDAALPLAWIGERLRRAQAEHVVVIVSSCGAGEPRDWLADLATGRAFDVVAADASVAGCPLADALLGGLCGDALDPRTGTVTFRSLGELLARRVPRAALQLADTSATVAQAPPLAGFWDVRRSQLANSPRPRSTEPEDLTGSVLPGRFRIDALVARGTFGTVYRAHQLSVERDVAVKVLHADIDPSSEDGRLFVDEIRAVGRIDHASVVRIHQADITHDGRLFYAMELLDGQDLQQLGQVPQPRAIELARQLLAGLGAAHAAGLVHADIKPANALVVKERVVLVDFGLARLRSTESAGGTPAYMAPEQLREGRVDARSDLFSAALVLIWLLTGWRRQSAKAVVPPLDTIADPALRAVLARAFDIDPAKRYQSAAELSAALGGSSAPTEILPPRLPFHQLAPITDRLYGREAEIARLVDHALYRRSVVYTAASGTGKTSLLRAGLLPRLEALGVHAIYVQCRGDTDLAALDAAVAQRSGRVVIVLDQLEAEPELAAVAVRYPEAAVVLSVREDHLARVLARLPDRLPIVRLPPLSPASAREAIVGPLAQARLGIEPALLEALLADLVRAGTALGGELGWGDARAVYPPHLQLACSILVEQLPAGAATLTLAHYAQLGGFDAIVGEHLERVVDSELGDRAAIARDLFVALVTSTHERAVRPEAELLELHPEAGEVLEILHARGLLVRVRADEPSWELVHDSLVPRVLAWVDRKDLARRRAVELVRYHLRRSRAEAPSLLGRAELREVKDHAAAIDELDAQWRDRSGWTPVRLVERSRSVLRRTTATFGSLLVSALAIASVGMYRSHAAHEREQEESSLRDRDLGKLVLELAPFDWDVAQQRAVQVPVSALPSLHWELRDPDDADPAAAGSQVRDTVRGSFDGARQYVETRGGHAFLVISGRGRAGTRCAPSVIPLAHLPGYARREASEPVLHIAVPTCAASAADLIEIPAGPFLFGGAGEPISQIQLAQDQTPESRLDLPRFELDRTEVTNAAYAVFSAMTETTGVPIATYPAAVGFEGTSGPRMPVQGLDWYDVRAYCAFVGKRLPTSEEWQKALRGPADPTNPYPRRNLPWGAPRAPAPAQLKDQGRTAEVGTHPDDRSPYGVLDLAGNVVEWTSTAADSFRVVRGGNWSDITAAELVDYLAIQNSRPALQRSYGVGVRCAR